MTTLFRSTLFIFGASLTAWSTKIESPDTTKFAPETLKVQSSYSQSGSLKPLAAEKMAAGQNGYLIATNEFIVQNSTALKDFIKHKTSRGFQVHVATEKDFGISEARKGRKQADLARKWMKENYKEDYLVIIEYQDCG